MGLLTAGFIERGREIDRLQAQADAAVTRQLLFAQAAEDPDGRVLDLQSDDGTLKARAVIEPDGSGFLAGQDLPELDGQDYQLWGVIGDQVISLGVLGSRPDVVPVLGGR